MIDLQRHCSTAGRRDIRVKVIGLGGAGGNALDRIILDGLAGAESVVMNTDAQALASSVASEKVQLGAGTTRGLGTGGDPEIGYAAAEESLDEIRASVEGVPLIFLCVGLGGGTGSGAARLIASVARQLGAFVIAFATMPFTFEGRRRSNQAVEALQALQSVSDVVICFENDRMGDSVPPRAGISEAFAVADQTISQSVRAIAALANQRGIIHLGFDELSTALRSGGRGASRCLFGCGEAEGDNRAHDALGRALKSPLMEKGRMLEDAHSVLVNVSGGPTLTLNEVQILMEEFGRHVSDQTQILFGATVDPRLGQKVCITIITAIAAPGATAADIARPAPRSEAGPGSVHPASAQPSAGANPASAHLPAAPLPSRLELPEPALTPTARKSRAPAASSPSASASSTGAHPHAADTVGDFTPADTRAKPPTLPSLSPDPADEESAPRHAAPDLGAPAASLPPATDLTSETLEPSEAGQDLPTDLERSETLATVRSATDSPTSTEPGQPPLVFSSESSSSPAEEHPAPSPKAGRTVPAPCAEPLAPPPELFNPARPRRPTPAPDLSLPPIESGPRDPATAAGAPAPRPKTARETKQEQMQFEPVTRGRFEKSEPTIVDGQDLDVPTFLRRNLKVK